MDGLQPFTTVMTSDSGTKKQTERFRGGECKEIVAVVTFMRMKGVLVLIIKMFSYKATPMRGVEGALKLKLSFDKNQLPLRSCCFFLLSKRCIPCWFLSVLGMGMLKLILGVWIKVNKKFLVRCSFWRWFGGVLSPGLPPWLVMKNMRKLFS